MDDNTFKLAIAIVGMLQIVALAYLAARQQSASGKLRQVHDLVNGLSHEKDAAVGASARAQGELAGRDFEANKHDALAALVEANRNAIALLSSTAEPMPVKIVGTEAPVPVVMTEEGEHGTK